MKPTIAAAAMAAALIALAGAAPAAAAPRTETFRYGPVTVGGYQVVPNRTTLDVPHPRVNGWVTGMDVNVVDADGTPVPIRRLMLHHIVFSNTGVNFEKRDRTCDSYTGFDSASTFPAFGERFYGAGEERSRLGLPAGYGYPMKANDRWSMTYMLMNHRATVDSAYIEWHVTYDTAPKKDAVPYWLDVKNCRLDPVFDVPGSRRRGSTYRRSKTWTVPQSGRLIAGGGHVHGGARNLTLRRTDCGGRKIYASRPMWGQPSHPFYNVRPILHEPGPISMSGFLSGQGFPVHAGERLRLDANYDDSLPHTRVMGIMVVFLAPDPGPPPSCGPGPTDVFDYQAQHGGRTSPPRFIVPLTGIRNGRAVRISAPPGRRVRLRSGATIRVGDRFFSRRNVSVRSGARLRWLFRSHELHNVTVASGPRGFSSLNLDRGRGYRKRLRVPGTYRIFCVLHPTEMTETVKVLRRTRR